MKLLKFVLSIVLSICILWGVLVYFGPIIFSKLLRMQFGDSVQVTGVEVTPKLKIKIGALDFNFSEDSESLWSGEARGLIVEFSKVFPRPHVKIGFGSGHVPNYGSFKKAKVDILLMGILDLSKIDSEAIFYDIETVNGVLVNTIEFDFNLLPKQKKLTVHSIDLNDVSTPYYGGFELQKVSGKFSDLHTDRSIYEQSNISSFQIFDIKSNFFELTAEKGSLHFINKNGNFEFNSSLDEIDFNHQRYKTNIASLQVDILQNNASNDLTADFTLLDLSVADLNVNIPRLRGGLLTNDRQHDIFISGELGDLELATDQLHVADIPSGVFEISSILQPLGTHSNLESKGYLSFVAKPNLRLSMVSNLELQRLDSIISSCEEFNCLFGGLGLDYTLTIDSENLNGNLRCPSIDCSSSNVTHTVKTENTNAFFGSLSQEKMFNPVAVAYAYSQMRLGEPSSLGHKLSLR